MAKEESAVLVKVDTQTKRRMKELDLNWSAEIRKFINDRIEKGKDDSDSKLAMAVMLTDKIFYSRKKSKYNSADIIRRFRDERYGPGSN